MSDPIRQLAERGYRGKAELEAVDRKLRVEYEREFAEKRANGFTSRFGDLWARQDQTAKIIGGIASLMLLFFVCLWITDALRVRHSRKVLEDVGDALKREIQTILPSR